MTRFSSEILLPFPNLNDLNSRELAIVIKTTTKTVIKNELKCFSMPEGSTCVAKQSQTQGNS